MRDVLYLAWRYLGYHRLKTAILVTSITLIAYLPVGLNVLVTQSADQLTARAQRTPLLVGAKGSPLELVLNSLYFESDPPAAASHAQVTRVAQSGLADPIPLYVRFRARGYPIVGTSLEYFDFRELRVAAGRPMAVLGECVLGATVAAELGLAPGGSVISSPESVFDLAGVYPLKMKVVGVLERSFDADDRAIFVDVKTAWVIEGLGHGHQDLSSAKAAASVLSRDGNQIVANAAVVQYNEITEENIDSFHFHGDLADFPLTAVLAVPRSEKDRVILMGRYQEADDPAQIVKPLGIMNDLLGTVFTVRSFVVAGMGLVGIATLLTAALVFMLSVRLRGREIQTMVKIGGSRARVTALLLSEVIVVVAVSAGLAACLTLLTSRYGSAVIRLLLLS